MPNSTTNEKNTASGVNTEAVLNFICRLTQTVLKKSDLSLMIVDDDSKRLKKLDAKLWSFDSVSFVPHNLLETSNINSSNTNSSNIDISNTDSSTIDSNNINSSTVSNTQSPLTDSNNISAPVTLTSQLPSGFDGVVLNLAAAPISLSNEATLPDRILEIITPDEISKQQGRDKYRLYRDLGYEVIYFPIN